MTQAAWNTISWVKSIACLLSKYSHQRHYIMLNSRGGKKSYFPRNNLFRHAVIYRHVDIIDTAVRL